MPKSLLELLSFIDHYRHFVNVQVPIERKVFESNKLLFDKYCNFSIFIIKKEVHENIRTLSCLEYEKDSETYRNSLNISLRYEIIRTYALIVLHFLSGFLDVVIEMPETLAGMIKCDNKFHAKDRFGKFLLESIRAKNSNRTILDISFKCGGMVTFLILFPSITITLALICLSVPFMLMEYINQ